jgi:hypothetical protein
MICTVTEGAKSKKKYLTTENIFEDEKFEKQIHSMCVEV